MLPSEPLVLRVIVYLKDIIEKKKPSRKAKVDPTNQLSIVNYQFSIESVL